MCATRLTPPLPHSPPRAASPRPLAAAAARLLFSSSARSSRTLSPPTRSAAPSNSRSPSASRGPVDRGRARQAVDRVLMNPDASLQQFLDKDFHALRRVCPHHPLRRQPRRGPFWSETFNREKALGKYPSPSCARRRAPSTTSARSSASAPHPARVAPRLVQQQVPPGQSTRVRRAALPARTTDPVDLSGWPSSPPTPARPTLRSQSTKQVGYPSPRGSATPSAAGSSVSTQGDAARHGCHRHVDGRQRPRDAP